MIRKIFGLSIFIALLAFSFFVFAACVSSGGTTQAQKTEETPTPRPTPTEEPVVAAPTPEPGQATIQPALTTPRPSAPPRVPGSSWMQPEEINVTVNQKFTTEIHVHTGDKQKIAAYGYTVTYDKSMIALDIALGNTGVESGPQGFVNAINANEPGQIKIAGFDVNGKDPGKNLSFLIIHWTAKAAGSTDINLDIKNINDNLGNPIGKPEATGTAVNIK
jgi:hypothetical protein